MADREGLEVKNMVSSEDLSSTRSDATSRRSRGDRADDVCAAELL